MNETQQQVREEIVRARARERQKELRKRERGRGRSRASIRRGRGRERKKRGRGREGKGREAPEEGGEGVEGERSTEAWWDGGEEESGVRQASRY